MWICFCFFKIKEKKILCTFVDIFGGIHEELEGGVRCFINPCINLMKSVWLLSFWSTYADSVRCDEILRIGDNWWKNKKKRKENLHND